MIKRMFFRKHALLRTVKMIIGILIGSFGTAIFYEIGWGSAPSSTASEGLTLFFNINYGTANAIINILCLLVIILTVPDLIGVGTLLAPLVFSLSIDFYLSIVRRFQLDGLADPVKLLLLVFGAALSGVGVGYYIAQNYGTGAIDGISVMLNRKFKIPYVYARWGVDGLQMASGIIMGAAWGVGTVISLLVVSPVVDFVIRHVRTDYDGEPGQEERK